MPRWSHPTDFFLNSKKSCSPITANDTVERIICYFRRKNCQRCLSDSRTTENDKKISRNILALKISPTQTRVFLSFLTSVKTGQYFLSAQDGFLYHPMSERRKVRGRLDTSNEATLDHWTNTDVRAADWDIKAQPYSETKKSQTYSLWLSKYTIR